MNDGMYNSPRLMDVFEAIARERKRQRELFAAGKHQFTVDSPVISDALKYAVLGEEFGDVGKEINEAAHRSDRTGRRRERLKKELVQTAAVCVAWLESLESAARQSTARSASRSTTTTPKEAA